MFSTSHRHARYLQIYILEYMYIYPQHSSEFNSYDIYPLIHHIADTNMKVQNSSTSLYDIRAYSYTGINSRMKVLRIHLMRNIFLPPQSRNIFSYKCSIYTQHMHYACITQIYIHICICVNVAYITQIYIHICIRVNVAYITQIYIHICIRVNVAYITQIHISICIRINAVSMYSICMYYTNTYLYMYSHKFSIYIRHMHILHKYIPLYVFAQMQRITFTRVCPTILRCTVYISYIP